MKGFRTIFSFFLLFIIFISLVLGQTGIDYVTAGDTDGDYKQGIGQFNAQQPNKTVVNQFPIDNTRSIPLVADLDNDGTSEIIVLDGSKIRIFHDSTLDQITFLSLPPNIYNTFIVFDIDGDGFEEIIIVGELGNATLPQKFPLIRIINYTNDTLALQQVNISLGTIASAGTRKDQQIMIACRGVNDCIAISNSGTNITPCVGTCPSIAQLKATVFNSTNLVTVVEDVTELRIEGGTNGGTGGFCFPRVRNVVVRDYDNDGDIEYIFSYFYTGNAQMTDSNDDFGIIGVNVNASNIVIVEFSIEDNDGLGADFNSVCNSNDGVGKHVTNPLVFDIDGDDDGIEEVVVGFQKTVDEFKMKSYSTDTGLNLFNGIYPLIEDSEGVLISNIFRANVFFDTGNNEFCVVGFNHDNGETLITCGTERPTSALGLPKTAEFKLDPQPFNLSDNFLKPFTLVHAVDESDVLVEGTDIDEVLTAFGIIAFDFDSSPLTCSTVGNCDAQLIYSFSEIHGLGELVAISVDYQRTGQREDIIGYTATNLVYLDDEIQNEGGEITSAFFDPCITDETVGLNSSLRVELRIVNPDIFDDQVSGSVILYLGTADEQREDSLNRSSNATIPFTTLVFNNTIVDGTMRLIGRDTGKPDEEDIIDVTFNVQAQGVVQGDCNENIDFITEEEQEILDALALIEEDAISRTIDDIDDLLGLGLGRTIIWLIIMVFVSYAIWTGGALERPDITFGIITLVNVLLLVIGFKLGFIGIGIIFIVIIGLLGSLAIRFRQMATGGG